MLRFSNIVTRITLIAIVIVSMAMQGCGSSKKNMSAPADTATSIVAPAAKKSPIDAQFDALVGTYRNWHDVYMPVNIDLESPKSLSASARMTMVRDSVIHVSMRLFGMEVAVVHVNNDSIYVADKFHKYLFAESLKSVMAQYPVTLANVQDLMLGRLFALGQNTLQKSDIELFDLSRDKGSNIWFAYPHTTVDGVSWHFAVTDKAPAAVQSLSFIRGDLPVNVSYSLPTSSVIGNISSVMSLSADFSQFDVAASLQFKLSDAQWNRNRTVDWQPPRNYKRLNASNIKSMFSF